MSSPVGLSGHRVIEHPADAGIEAWAPSLPAAFEEAAMGLCELMLDRSVVEERMARTIVVSGDDESDLLVRWLTEVLYLMDAKSLAFHRLAVSYFDGKRLVATGYGEAFDPVRHGGRVAVKAATYHRLMVEPGPPAFVRIVVDV